MRTGNEILIIAALVLCMSALIGSPSGAGQSWTIGEPIVGYWGGPGYPGALPLTAAYAKQLKDGGWNLVHCTEADIPVVNEFGMRMLLRDPLIAPQSLDNPQTREMLDALINRIKDNPNMYMYYLVDEPSAKLFPDYAKLVAYLRERDPKHAAYIDLFPTYASNEMLGETGEFPLAYKAYVNDFITIIRPDFISYDNYHFFKTPQNVSYDANWYFQNLALIRQAACDANLPFMNIIQCSSWASHVRVPTPKEFRWLVYTSIAYGAQATCQYVYYYPEHAGNMVDKDGNPTELYFEAQKTNFEFIAIVKQLKDLKSMGAYHAGIIPPGGTPLPSGSVFQFVPKIPKREYVMNQQVSGYVMGLFGKNREATRAVIVNLDYRNSKTISISAPADIEVFNTGSNKWSKSPTGKTIELNLPAGSGKLIRLVK
jgi:hypothetical protein